ncbi:MAG TPA: phosphodiester glycosidase family protein [bacterium]|nr:phosphodiester glycosidase family protein [bacterium]
MSAVLAGFVRRVGRVFRVLLVATASVAAAAGGAMATRAKGAVDAPAKSAPEASGFRELEPGLELGAFALGSAGGARATVHVVRVDPARFGFTLLNASAPGEGETRSAKDWCARAGGVACINAAMYRADERTATGYMKSGAHVNNAHWNGDNAVLAFGASDAKAPRARIFDRTCEDVPKESARYATLVQSIRMLDCQGGNAWKAQPRKWSTAAIGQDAAGRLLLLHARDALPVHDFVEGLRALPLKLTRLMYVEGGPEAQLWVSAGGETHEYLGSYESGFWENDDNAEGWRIPNVVAVKRLSPASPADPQP